LAKKKEVTRPAGFWIRLLAFLIDSIIIGIVCYGFLLTFRKILSPLGQNIWYIGFFIAGLYFVPYMTRLGKGQTIGKRITRIRVVGEGGKFLTFSQASYRYSILAFFFFSSAISDSLTTSFRQFAWARAVLGLAGLGLMLGIVLLIAFTKEKRGLHDYLARTAVVKAGAPGFRPISETKHRKAITIVILVALALWIPIEALRITFMPEESQQMIGGMQSLGLDDPHMFNSTVFGTTDLYVSGHIPYSLITNPMKRDEKFSEVSRYLLLEIPDIESVRYMFITLNSGYTMGIAFYNPSHSMPYSVQDEIMRYRHRDIIEENASSAPNRLSLTGGPMEIGLNDPVELDFLSKGQFFGLRKAYVDEHPDLVSGEYHPYEAVYGKIEGDRPWWGLNGQFCLGEGSFSIAGASEESRHIANPFLLLSLDEGKGFSVPAYRDCFPTYPRPVLLMWYPDEARAEATYDMTRLISEREQLKIGKPFFDPDSIEMKIDNFNARDFGFNYFHAEASDGVIDAPGGALFEEAVNMEDHLRHGRGCDHPEGCNNNWGNYPKTFLIIEKIPSLVNFKLWETEPEDISQEADFTFTIRFV